MLISNARKLGLALVTALLLGSQSHGATPTQALFSTAKTPAGQPVATQLEKFQTISDADVVDLKAAVLKALVKSGMKPLEQVDPSTMQIGVTANGITAMSYDGKAEFNVFIRPNGEVEMRHLKTAEMASAFEVFLNTQIFMAQLGRIRFYNKGDELFCKVESQVKILADAVQKMAPVNIDPSKYEYRLEETNGVGMVFFRHADHHFDFNVSADGKVGFGTALGFGSERSLYDSLKPADQAHVSREKLTLILSLKGADFANDPRISALYDALAAIVSDDRWDVSSVGSKMEFSAKGLSPVIDLTGLRDIDGGTLSLQTRNGETITLQFEAGHFNIGTALVKPEAWLYGEGEVGNQVGLYSQLNSK